MEKFVLLFIILILKVMSASEIGDTKLLFNSNFIKYDLKEKEEKLFDKDYFKSVILSEVKGDSKGNIFVATPRIIENVNTPATFGIFNPTNKTFTPFPSFEMNNCIGNECLENVHSFEVDCEDNLWILDNGIKQNGIRIEGSKMKLIIYDLQNQKIDSTYIFDDHEEVSYLDSYLKAITIDCENDIAYFVDAGVMGEKKESNFTSAILAFDKNTGLTKRILHGTVFSKTKEEKKCPENIQWGISMLSLDCEFAKLYFSSNQKKEIYSIETDPILMYMDNSYLNNSVDIEREYFGSSHMIMDERNNLYLTNLKNNTIEFIDGDELQNKKINFAELSNQTNSCSFAYSIGFSADSLILVSNSFCDFINGKLKEDNFKNFEIYKIYVGRKSYVNSCEFVGYRFGVIEISVLVSLGIGIFGMLILVLVVENVISCVKKAKKKKNKDYNILN